MRNDGSCVSKFIIAHYVGSPMQFIIHKHGNHQPRGQ